MSFYPASYSDAVAENAARFIYDRRGLFDVALISGDLSTTGRADDLKEAYDFVLSPARNKFLSAQRRPTLQGGIRTRFLVPGNHDRYVDNHGNAGSKNFELKFQEDWPGPTVRVLVLQSRDRLSRLAILAADFCLRNNQDALRPTRMNRRGRGRAYEDIIEQLERNTANVRAQHSPIPIVWTTHFPPDVETASWLRLLRDDLVMDAASRQSVPIILSGHLHRRIEHLSQGIHIFCAGSMTSCEEDGNQWIHLLEFEVQGEYIQSCQKTDFRWDDGQTEFVPSGQPRNFSLRAVPTSSAPSISRGA
jgi:3',5'-cyclic AMP phosphodiesterase CpdA